MCASCTSHSHLYIGFSGKIRDGMERNRWCHLHNVILLWGGVKYVCVCVGKIDRMGSKAATAIPGVDYSSGRATLGQSDIVHIYSTRRYAWRNAVGERFVYTDTKAMCIQYVVTVCVNSSDIENIYTYSECWARCVWRQMVELRSTQCRDMSPFHCATIW